VALPAWSALIVHVPLATSVILRPLVPPVVHTDGVVEVKVTARPDDDVALTVTGDCDICWSSNDPNVIVCVAFEIVKLRLTAGAAL
jgi:hypothetical protein